MTRLKIQAQLIPPFEPLLASMPSGRDIHTVAPFSVPALDKDTLTRMRAPVDEDARQGRSEEGDSDLEDENFSGVPPGTFPGTTAEYQGRVYY